MLNFIKSLFKPKPVYIREVILIVNGRVKVSRYELFINGFLVEIDTTDEERAIKYITKFKGKRKTVEPDYGISRHSKYLTRYIKI